MRKTAIFTLVGTAATLLIVNLANVDGANTAGIISEAQAEQVKHMVSPVKAREDHEVYYPGTEDLAPDEMRVTACGTGMPNARPKQAAACWLVELGNGDKFLFDIGTGSAERISALKIPYNFIDKVFIGHLHSDHFGDLDALWVGGVVGNRVVPLRVWGPSSSEPKYGTKKALEAMEEMLAWDVDSRMGNTDTRGLFMEVTEFDYRAINEVIYEENGVTIRTIVPEQVVDGIRKRRRHRDSRMLHLAGIARGQAELHARSGTECRHPDPYVTGAVRQGHGGYPATSRSRLSLLQ
jgi:ribonuclease Z